MWRCAREREFPDEYIRVIQDMYRECKTRVQTTAGAGETSVWTLGYIIIRDRHLSL